MACDKLNRYLWVASRVFTSFISKLGDFSFEFFAGLFLFFNELLNLASFFDGTFCSFNFPLKHFFEDISFIEAIDEAEENFDFDSVLKFVVFKASFLSKNVKEPFGCFWEKVIKRGDASQGSSKFCPNESELVSIEVFSVTSNMILQKRDEGDTVSIFDAVELIFVDEFLQEETEEPLVHVIQESQGFIALIDQACIDFFLLNVFNFKILGESIEEVPDLEDITKILRFDEASFGFWTL